MENKFVFINRSCETWSNKNIRKKAVIPDGLRLLQAFGDIFINLICSCSYKITVVC